MRPQRPVRNVSRSLRSQRIPGRASEPIETRGLKGASGSRLLPGTSGVESPPGHNYSANTAERYGDSVGAIFGGKTDREFTYGK
jgi:hypothetical protein